MSLLDDLKLGEKKAARELPCPLCDAITETADEPTRMALADAAAGTIGIHSLATILRDNGIPAGRRTIVRHRSEGHKP